MSRASGLTVRRFVALFSSGFVAGMLFSLFGTVCVQAQVPGEQGGKILHVNIQHSQAADENPGTEELPLKTINKAVEIAKESNRQAIGVKIIIYPGTYRESIRLYYGQKTDAPLILEAKEKGSIVLSGSDIWSGWQRQGSSDIYTHPWPYNWGLTSYPPSWAGHVTLADIVRRREMIFANGELLEQVLSYSELKEKSFYVSEGGDTVSIRLAAGTDITKTTIEVATRPSLVQMDGVRNVVLRGLVFQHANTPLEKSAVTFTDSSSILVEDCKFLWNNWYGFSYLVSQNVTARRNVANHNGGTGMGVWQIKNLLFEDNETSYNNWRGALGAFYDWDMAGGKFMLVHEGTFRRHRSIGNQAHGFWFDNNNINVLLEEAFLCDNLTHGLYVEISPGPVTIKNSVICHNQLNGILIANSRDVTLEESILYGNKVSQIMVGGVYDAPRPTTNWETGETIMLKAEHSVLRQNVIAGKDASQFLLKTTLSAEYWGYFQNSLTASKNLWYVAEVQQVFQLPEGKRLDFRGWQSATGQDMNSVFADPQFSNPANQDFSFLSNSPLLRKEEWLTRENTPSGLIIAPMP